MIEAVGLGILFAGAVGAWVCFWQLTINAEVARAVNDVQMRALIGIHKELCRMNDRFTPGVGPQPPEVPQHLQNALRAIRPEAPR